MTHIIKNSEPRSHFSKTRQIFYQTWTTDGLQASTTNLPCNLARGANGVRIRFTPDGHVLLHTMLLSKFTAIRKRLDHGVAALDRGPRGGAPSCVPLLLSRRFSVTSVSLLLNASQSLQDTLGQAKSGEHRRVTLVAKSLIRIDSPQTIRCVDHLQVEISPNFLQRTIQK